MAKRMKYVYKTSEIAHLWAHKTQSSARNPQNNFYFDGDTIYSYGSHFPIARHVTLASGREVVLFTTRGYSSTTSQHIHSVRRAIPSQLSVIPCQNPRSTIEAAMRGHNDICDEALKDLLNAKSKPSKAVKYRNLLRYNRIRATVYEITGTPYTEIMPPNSGEYHDILIEHEHKAIVAAEKSAETRRLNYEQSRMAQAAPLEDRIAAWRAGGYSALYNVPAMLRIKGNNVETSLGAVFPLDHAVKALPLVLVYIRNGRTYQRNGHTIHLGHYAIDSIDEHGTLKAGCHTISKEEIEHFAKLVEENGSNVRPTKENSNAL